MKLIIALCCLSLSLAAPLKSDEVKIISYENNNDGLGQYNFAFETSDGTKRQEQSEIVNAGDPKNEKIIVRGYFSFIAPDGVTYTVNYIADENGFQPQGDHIIQEPGEVVPVDPRPPDFLPPAVIASLLGK